MKLNGIENVPRKYLKKYKTGRWKWITKIEDDECWVIGMERISTGEEVYF